MPSDGTTFCPRHISDPVVTEDLDGMGRTAGGPHRDGVGVETTTVSATRWLSELPLPPVWTIVSALLCSAGEKAETCTSTFPASPETEHLPPVLVAPEFET